MRIQLLSDLHFEFHADDGRSFVASLDPSDVDVLVLAGDIAVGDGITGALDLFCARYAKATVLYVGRWVRSTIVAEASSRRPTT